MTHAEARAVRQKELVAEHGEVKIHAAVNIAQYADGAMTVDVVYDPVPSHDGTPEKMTSTEMLAEMARTYLHAILDRAGQAAAAIVLLTRIDRNGVQTEEPAKPRYPTDPSKYDA